MSIQKLHNVFSDKKIYNEDVKISLFGLFVFDIIAIYMKKNGKFFFLGFFSKKPVKNPPKTSGENFNILSKLL
jgi:hypothetical protein